MAGDLLKRARIDIERNPVLADPLRIDFFRGRPVTYAGFLAGGHIDQVQIDACELCDSAKQSLQHRIAGHALGCGKEQDPIFSLPRHLFCLTPG